MKNIIKTDLDAITYTAVVNELVENYFTSDGNYAPHFGLFNAMCTFYNVCVIESKLDDKLTSEMTALDAVNVLATNSSFMTAFNDAICDSSYCLNFANAYRDAMEIIDIKKSPMNIAVNMLKNALDDIIDKIAPVLNEDNIKNIGEIAKSIAGNNNLSKTLIEEYIKSGRFKEIVGAKNGTPNLSAVE